MRENILYQSFNYLNKMLNKKQKRFALGLLVLMFIGMTAEILLLNNLMILINYLTNTSLDTPKIVEYFSQFFKENKNNNFSFTFIHNNFFDQNKYEYFSKMEGK